MMRAALFLLFTFLLLIGPAGSATYPTCAYFGLKAPCFNTATDIGDMMVNVRVFGAKGDGTTDDAAAIQAAIDYAYNNHIQGIYCPSGDYRTTTTIYLDAPGNLRANFSSPTIFSFSLAFIGGSGGLGNHQGFGCRIKPTFDNAVAFIIGPGQQMKVSGISIIGPNAATYRGNLNSNGIGLGIAGGSAGASSTLIENTDVENFYTLYETNANGGCCLSDSNTWRKIDGNNGRYGLYLNGTQSDINDLQSSRLGSVTTTIYSPVARPITVIGGNLSSVSGVSASFGISSISSFTKTADGNGNDYTFTGVIASADSYWPNVYNSFIINTTHFGPVPLTLTTWNGGNPATFQILPGWDFGNFGTVDLTTTTDIQAEVAAATKIYAAERIEIAHGLGISIEGAHIENSAACESLYIAGSGFGGAQGASLKNLFFNADPGLPNYAPSQSPTDGQLALFYCQQEFPFIQQQTSTAHLDIDGGDFAQLVSSPPILLEQGVNRFISGRNLRSIAPLNQRIWNNGGAAYAQVSGNDVIETVTNGAGEWDRNYSWPTTVLNGNAAGFFLNQGRLTVPYYGYRPAPGQLPNLNPSTYSLVSGALGALGSYPPIDCETFYRSVDPNSGALTHLFLRSASCPGYSWGKNLTDTPVGGTVTWSYKGGSVMLYLDAKTITWMFPGQGFTLAGGSGDGSAGADTYVVTAVYPQLGFITAVDVTALGPTQGKPLPGTKTTVYSCSSSCTVGQVSYSWTAY